MGAAILHYEPVFSKWDQSFGFKKTLKKIKSEIEFNDIKIPVYLLPIAKDKPSEKAMKGFSSYLYKEGITHIYYTKQAEAMLPHLPAANFNCRVFDGSFVINYKLVDIIKKYAVSKNLNVSTCTVTILSDDPEKVKQTVLKLYRYVKKISIKTKNMDGFSNLLHYFLYEYGLFIGEPEETENEIKLYLDGDFYKEADILLGKEKYNEIIFKCKQNKEFKNILTELNQKVLELLIFAKYVFLNEKTVNRFLKELNVKIVKIK